MLALLLGLTPFAQAQAATDINLDDAVLVTPADLSAREGKAVGMLVDELQKRTLVRWSQAHEWPTGAKAIVAVGPERSIAQFAGPWAPGLAATPGKGSEGYRLRTFAEGSVSGVVIVGNDERGVLFGVGRLLRELRIERDSVRIPHALDINTAPAFPLRGHQCGYRPKVNTYDGWTPPMWEQYIRDMAVFGTNAIEMMPPRTDDDADSPHFPLPQIDMMAIISQIADEYGIDVWIWYPAMDEDYSDAKTVEFALKEWGEVFARLPRIDAVFVPGGDPGHTQPKHLMALLEKETEVLHRTHPEAQMWMSPQSFTAEWMDEFLTYMQKEQPTWLSGIVFGPQNRIGLPELRKAIPAQYPIRRYPDITHSIRCQYPVPDWDVAFVATEDREVINPRPVHYAQIFRLWDQESCGFLTYSEGVNDDVNKFVWSGLGWDPETPVLEILRQYSRYFIGASYEDDYAQAQFALERNWQGPLLTNAGVDTTLQQVQAMERSASPQTLLNWRFQQTLYRAYYDAFVRTRLLYETQLEAQALEVLRQAPRLGTAVAVSQAEAILEKALTEPVGEDLRARVFELAEALYQSIRMQLSVPRYKGIHWGRGANLDLIDRPMNNREWLLERFAELQSMNTESERLAAIMGIVNWTNPGPGGFYDDLGNPAQQAHLVRTQGPDTDPENRESPLVGFAYRSNHRMSWNRHAESRYDAPLKMRYTDLDPGTSYVVRAVYAGDRLEAKLRLVADDSIEIHPYIPKENPLQPVEFAIPVEATADGELTLTWTQEPGSGGSGRGCQIAEVWLIKKTE
ncbi:MAG: hypothetical protein IT365_00170 [Candidatus Hydrogenedentes bacterium]|nr:hypothetical protein [Candidatus Hydrogenedentota bacterium]